MPLEPVGCQSRDFLELSRFFEQMSRPRHNLKLNGSVHLSHGLAVKLDDGEIVSADD